MILSPNTNTIIRFLETINFSEDYKNVLDFPSKSSQEEFFISRTKFMLDNYTFLNRDNKIRLGINIEVLYNVNYIMYKNKDKYIYCFIKSKSYLNDNTTEIEIVTDIWQTFLFNFELLPSFVVREHTTTDYIGEHLVDEGLATGEYIVNGKEETNYFNEYGIIISSTSYPYTDAKINITPSIINNIVQGLTTLYCENINALTSVLLDMNTRGKVDTIQNIYMMPKSFIIQNNLANIATGVYEVMGDLQTKNFQLGLTRSINGYSPKNNKLYCYPYTCLDIINNQGQLITLHWEKLNNNIFKIHYNLSPNGSACLYPSQYNNLTNDTTNLITLGDFPICSWTSVTYNTWVAQNKNSNLMKTVTNIGALGIGAFTGNPVLLTSGAMSTASMLTENSDRQNLQNTASGNTTGNGSNVAFGLQDFTFISKSITNERAKIIDDYFNKYGYKVNRVKTPQFNSMTEFNYIETKDIGIVGQFDSEDRKVLQNIFNNGVTVWHNPYNFLNYGVNNIRR